MRQLKVYPCCPSPLHFACAFYPGVDIQIQDGVLFSLPFAHSCVLTKRTRSLTSQGGGMTVLGTRSLFLCSAGSDVLVAESEDLLENDTDEGVIFISSLLSFLRFAFG